MVSGQLFPAAEASEEYAVHLLAGMGVALGG
jgi:hypothetical protein